VVLKKLWFNPQISEVFAMSKQDDFSKLQTQHQLILDSAGEGVYGLDAAGKITFSNAAATEILGWEINDVLGQRAHDVHHHSHSDGSAYPRDECPIYAALKDGEVHTVDCEVFWHANGSAVEVEYTSTPILVDGKPEGAVVLFRDITQRRKTEREREEAYAEIQVLKEQLELERD
jgi:PAS domain S-box-containing protein